MKVTKTNLIQSNNVSAIKQYKSLEQWHVDLKI